RAVSGKRHDCDHSPLIGSVFMTWLATSGSRSRTVITPITTERPLMVQRGLVGIAPPAPSAEVPGATDLRTSARPSVTESLPMTGITPWASGSAGPLLFLEVLAF